MLTAQQIFDTVVNHLRSMTKQSAYKDDHGDNFCKYRGPNGSKCAIGCMISDDEYNPNMEGAGVNGLMDKKMLPIRFHDHINLLVSLQAAHDTCRYWDSNGFSLIGEDRLRQISEGYELTYTPRS